MRLTLTLLILTLAFYFGYNHKVPSTPLSCCAPGSTICPIPNERSER